MNLGKIKISLIIFVFGFFTNSYSEDRILSAPIINLESLEKVFIFNGWTFSSNPSLASIDHAIYDVWLVSCENA